MTPRFKNASPFSSMKGSSKAMSLFLAVFAFIVVASALAQEDSSIIQIACQGNSIQYFNDCPRLLEQMFLAASTYNMSQNSCLRGGASIVSIWTQGNGMEEKFATPNARLPNGTGYDIGAPTVQALLKDDSFDFIIVNDQTQSPTRNHTRHETIKELKKKYAPLFIQSNITPVLLQTAAYRVPGTKESADLGDFDAMTKLLQEGYHNYKQELDTVFHKSGTLLQTRIAPVGNAYKELHDTAPDLWKQLYHTDDLHPSPHGTLLQGFVLYITITGEAPPTNYDPSTWWSRARRMQPPEEPPLPLPTIEEAKSLRSVASKVCGMSDTDNQ